MASIIYLIRRTIMNKVELLAPCGTYESFLAAVKAGADAVYLGLDKFGARANAGNFTIEELKDALQISHVLNKKIYLTVNTLFKDDEMGELFSFLKDPYIYGLDGVIVQDIGVMKYISEHFPGLPVHASTQAAITSPEAFDDIKNFNVTRIVPARELSLEEIRTMKKVTGCELECFIHGALCYSYSGKCLFSSFLGERSGNRGRCAQPCRLIYNDSYILSMKDLCTIDNIPEMIEAGISSFKIEGRMKSSEYVYGVTSIYRKYIDLYYSGRKYSVDKNDKEKLLSLYTRSGNCNGYYHKHNGRDMITISSPSYNSNGNNDTVNLSEIKLPKRRVNVKAVFCENQNIEISVFDNEIKACVTTDIVPQKAQNQALTKELISKQLCKTGNTLFEIEDLEIGLDDNLFLSNGQLNAVRRAGLEEFMNIICSSCIRADDAVKDNLKSTDYDSQKEFEIVSDGNPSVNVSVLTKDQAFTSLAYAGVTGLIMPCFLIASMSSAELSELKSKTESNKTKLYLQLPIVFRNDVKTNSVKLTEDSIKSLLNAQIAIAGVYVSNLEGLTYIKNHYDYNIFGDIHTYAYNNNSIDTYKELGVENFTSPVELTYRELIKRNNKSEELIIYGRMPMMVSAGCIQNTQEGCKFDKEGQIKYISDRKGAKLPVFCNCTECCNFVFNSIPTYLADKKNEISKLSPQSLRIMFTDESQKNCKQILNLVFGDISSRTITYRAADFDHTRGHFNKGID